MAKDLFKAKIFTYLDTLDILAKEEALRFELLYTPNDYEKLEDLALLLYHKGDYDGAIKLYKKILNNQEDAKQIAFLGYLYFEQEKYHKAIQCFEDSLDINSEDPFVYFLLGNAYSRTGNIVEAVQNYDFAIFLDLDIYKAHLDFAEKYEKLGLKERAIYEYKIAYEIDPRNKEIKTRIENLKSELNWNE